MSCLLFTLSVLILRMRSVPAIDISAMRRLEELYQSLKKKEIMLLLSHVNEQPMHALEKEGFVKMVGKENFCTNINEAIERAKLLIKEN